MDKKLLFSCVFLSFAGILNAQMVGSNAYIKGTGVEIGIDGAGGFEGCNTVTSPPPAGMHYRSGTNFFGFVANPQNDGWTNFDGDFFTPGTPENGWGFEIGTGGLSRGNNCAPALETSVNGAITNWSHVGTTYSVDWEGDDTTGTNLHFKINYLLEETDLFYKTTVTITNNTASVIPDLYYYRNLDPDNNESISFDFTTQNTIVSQPVPGGTSVAEVSGAQTTPWNSIFTFVADDTNFIAGYGGFTNRDASDMYNGIGFTQTVGSTVFVDEAIYLAYRVQNLAPAGSATLRSCSVFDSSSVQCATRSLRVSLTTPSLVYNSTPAFALTGGSPAGGTYSGTGVTGNMFDPSSAGVGAHAIVYSYTDSTGCTGNAASVIHVDIPAGVAVIPANANVAVYPNPFSEQTTVMIGKEVKLVNAEFHLYDITGKEVMVMKDLKSNEFKLQQKDLAPGAYFYKLINDGKQVSDGKVLVK